MPIKSLLASYLAAFSLWATSPAHAQAVLSGTLEEQFASPVNVSGVLLVGLASGTSAGRVDPDLVSIRLPEQATAGPVCFNATTRDGQYWARGRLTAPVGPATTYQVSRSWRFRAQLLQYSQDDIAFRARTGANCDQAQSAPLIPVTLGGTDPSIVAQINAGNALAVSAQVRVGGAVTPARCTAARGRRSTAFTHTCLFPAPRLASWTNAEMTITRMLESGASRSATFSILLPAGG
jgi:hypothetical protein